MERFESVDILPDTPLVKTATGPKEVIVREHSDSEESAVSR